MKKLSLYLVSLALAGASLLANATEINQASMESLEAVKGLGPAYAKKIVAEREKGPFTSWENLSKRVKGLTGKRAQKLSDAGLTIEGQPYSAAKKAAKKPAKDSAAGKEPPADSKKQAGNANKPMADKGMASKAAPAVAPAPAAAPAMAPAPAAAPAKP